MVSLDDSNRMTAVLVPCYGEIIVGRASVPQAGPGQIQVRIAAASINPLDVRLPRGDFRDHLDVSFPHVPGNDFAGTVTAVGDGVPAYAIGDEVFGHAVPRVLRTRSRSPRRSRTSSTAGMCCSNWSSTWTAPSAACAK
jgi:NADPH:quinone reductase-like Zn-dependent oxidoreductase